MVDTLVLIGTRKGLWTARSADRTTWELAGPRFGMQAIYSVALDTRTAGPPRLLVGATSEHWGPGVFRSDDLGQTWQEPVEGAIRFGPDQGASVERIWQIQPDLPQRPGVVWAGTEPSALWRSNDGGETFALVEGLWDHPHRPSWFPGGGGQALHTVLPDPADDRGVLVAMSTGGVYVTDDGGASWEPSNTGIPAHFMPDPYPEYGQCVHKVARDGADPRRLYAQNHGGLLRSQDAGATWTSIAEGLPADFGFPVVAHPRRAGTAYVVPLVADVERVPPDGILRVWRTDDAGDTWRPLTAGLPDTPSWISVLRDAACTDDADPAGVYVGTRDGVVYASADEGEHWSVLATHLPDILCIRAASYD